MPAIIKSSASFSDYDLQLLASANPGWQFERSDDGALLVSPTATPGGAKSGEAFAQLYAYAKRDRSLISLRAFRRRLQ
jgi:Uma2 family endonuclease